MAAYISNNINASQWNYAASNTQLFELLWIRASNVFLGSHYYPPTPIYPVTDLLQHLEQSTEVITTAFPGASIGIAGDMNMVPNQDIIDAMD